MGYSDNPDMVRVDFFKKSGKWYTTEAVKWIGYDTAIIHDAFKESLREHFNGSKRLNDMFAICLEPYHKNAFPLMIEVSSIWEEHTYENIKF